MTDDPFAHHPGLRDKIADPAANFFRNTTLDDLARVMDEHGLPGGWWRTDAEREALRHAFLAPYRGTDLWVFAYGSLMWDPGFHFAEVRRAVLPGHARRFILRDIYGGRGRPEAPGLMAALDVVPGATGCHGLLFRIEAAQVEAETAHIWRREMIAPAYIPVVTEALVDEAPLPALTFVADHSAELIVPDISRAAQIDHLRTGAGFLGTSMAYLENIATHFEELGIVDPEVDALLAAARDAL